MALDHVTYAKDANILKDPKQCRNAPHRTAPHQRNSAEGTMLGRTAQSPNHASKVKVLNHRVEHARRESRAFPPAPGRHHTKSPSILCTLQIKIPQDSSD
eukprot:36448-Pyramimonas_sp.AAC.1